MEVILRTHYKKLGQKGDVVTVRAGYGRNYLIPQGIAMVANSTNKKVMLEDAKQAAKKMLKRKTDAQALVAALEAAKVVVKAKVGEGGHIFGSITPLQLAKALKEQGILVEYTSITLLEVPIKKIGRYQATLALHEEFSYTLHFDVVPA